MVDKVKDFCSSVYDRAYDDFLSQFHEVTNPKKLEELKIAAQKNAIKVCIMQGLKHFPKNSAAEIWKDIYEIHVHKKSGIDDSEIIANVISADQSWKKSSGHAFEEMISLIGTDELKRYDIRIVLQRELNTLIKENKLFNEPRDISWLKEQILGNVFDLYSLVKKNGKEYCFGCVQCKTSIRDRVTRDREPSIHAMQSFFWSTVIVLDGDFLRLPKFIHMVNGGSMEFPTNGWHGMYVFTKEDVEDRIYHTDISLDIFKNHAFQAAKQWLNQRQWFNNEWYPK